MGRKLKFKPTITRVKLNPEQAVLTCGCYTTGGRWSGRASAGYGETTQCATTGVRGDGTSLRYECADGAGIPGQTKSLRTGSS
jgi:hypothetical protein